MNPNSQTLQPGQPDDPIEEKKTERTEEKINLKQKLQLFIEDLPYEQRKILKETKWENGDKKWEDGFLEFVERRVARAGKFGVTMFKDYIKALKREYENTSASQDREHKNLLKGQMTVAEKMFGLYSSEKPEETAADKKERMKGIYSKENILFTLRNIRRQIFELVGMKDPWWDYSKQQQGMAQLESRGFGKTAEQQPQSAPKRPGTPKAPDIRPSNDNASAPSEHPREDKAA